MSLMIDGWMPSVGSSRMRSFGCHRERAADRELLLLSAGQVAAAPAQHVREHREHLEDALRNAPRRAAWSRARSRRFSSHGEPRKDLATLRHVAQPEPRPRVRRQPRDVAPSKPISPERAGSSPMRHLQQRRLADAVAAEDGRDWPRTARRTRRRAGVAAAVVLVERVVTCQQHRPSVPDASEHRGHPSARDTLR